MDAENSGIMNNYESYSEALQSQIRSLNFQEVEELASELFTCWLDRKTVFLCGNGGSGANAIHIANDWLYATSGVFGKGIRVEALPSNQAVLTALANDEGYDSVFSFQLAVKADQGDTLIVLSGSGNSPNILSALSSAKKMGMKTVALLGFDGGKAKQMADRCLHFNIDDMQISEDLQLIVGHMVMKSLSRKFKGAEAT